jgi:hypothetical protein
MTTQAAVVDGFLARTYGTTAIAAAVIGLWSFCVWGAKIGLNVVAGALLGIGLLWLLAAAVHITVGAPPDRVHRRRRLVYGPLHVLKYGVVAGLFYMGVCYDWIVPLALAAGYTLIYAVMAALALAPRLRTPARTTPAD